MGASSDTPSHSQAQQMLDELRAIRMAFDRLDRTLTDLPIATARLRSERRSERYDLLLKVLGGAVLGVSAGLLLGLAGSRILGALLG